jgi:ribosomal-protein-alanine N-acetyltransferase
MPDGITITPATRADVRAVHAIEEASFPAPWRREFFEVEIGASGRLNLVAKRGDTVVGYLFAMWILDDMHINKIAVCEPERRRGIADALMAACFESARAEQIRKISLEVRRSNRGAQEFYARLDFRPAGARRRYYPDGEDAVVMTKELP